MNSVLTSPISRSVGRPREFDEGEVLDAVMRVFWHQGYEGTSLADLLAATGLHKGSLYQAFGDKHTLFVTALRRYIHGVRAEMTQVLQDAPSAIEGMRAALYKSIDMGCDGDRGNPGCLALNTLVEKGPQDPEILAVLEDEFANRMESITGAVNAAQHEGSIRNDWPAERIASMIHVVLAGLSVSLKGPMNSENSKALIDDLLETLA